VNRPLLLRALLLAGLAAGCLGAPAQPEYFTLSPAAGASGAPLAARPELGLVLGQVELPRYLDRSELVTRNGPHQLQVWGGVRWGGSLRTDIARVVADDLGRLLGTARVAVYPVEARFPVSYRVLLELLEFGGAAGGPVTLRARWTIAAADGRALAVGESGVEQAPASPAWADYVAAHSAALAIVTREIAERLAALP
jgi:uncharacterized protein